MTIDHDHPHDLRLIGIDIGKDIFSLVGSTRRARSFTQEVQAVGSESELAKLPRACRPRSVPQRALRSRTSAARA